MRFENAIRTYFYLGAILTLLISPISAKAQLSQSEAGFGCEGGRCIATAQKSNVMSFCEEMKARAAWASDWQCQNVAIYDDGNDKASIMDLRYKPESLRTNEERAILQAANRTGFIRIPGCDFGSNAFLVRINGRDAVITSGHFVANIETGKFKKECTKEQLANAIYYPNASYMDLRKGRPQSDSPIVESVSTTGEPLNMDNIIGTPFNRGKDWLGFYLSEQISEQKSIDGSERGYLKFSSSQGESKGYLIGFDPTFDKQNGGRTSTYQKCDFSSGDLVFHTCDTSKGTSSSLLAVMDNGELKFQGMNISSHESGVVDLPEDDYNWNLGISSSNINQQLPLGKNLDTGSIVTTEL